MQQSYLSTPCSARLQEVIEGPTADTQPPAGAPAKHQCDNQHPGATLLQTAHTWLHKGLEKHACQPSKHSSALPTAQRQIKTTPMLASRSIAWL